MNTKKATKRALLTSVMALVMCVVMLVGTTFAWFTDTASTGVNKIVAGNLKVDIIGENSENHVSMLNFTKAAGAEGEELFWEPGCRYVTEGFRIANKGNLALKWKAQVNKGTTAANEGNFNLLDVIDFYLVTKAADGTETETPLDEFTGNLTAGVKSNVYYIKGVMRTTAGNDYQGLTLNGITITVYATQDTVENDSFNNQYDAGAEADEFHQGVTISGIAGVADSYGTIQEAYEEVKAMLVANSGLSEEALSEDAFNAFFTDGGKITWTIYGNQKVTETRMFSFGRAANRFGEGRHITEIDIIGGNSSAALDLTAVNGSFALPYNWWNVEDSANTALKCKNITFNGIKYMPSATYQCTLYPTTYEFDGCTFNGNLYSYQNFDVDMTIKNCTFNAPAATQYAFMSQGKGGTIKLENNVFNNYTRGINLERATADFVITNNTIVSTVSEPDRGAIQLTDGKSFVVTGNKVDVNAGNAFWFHNAAKNSDVTYTISNNDIKAPYIGYYGTSFDVNEKITSSGNKFNNTDTTKCMKKDATVAEATNLTAIR
jgi:predicted ribosomally synthesized peptide with SipW-like signal peptide